MKLHLPLTLLAALLAVLTQPITYAADTEYPIAPTSAYEYTNDGILEGIEYDGYDFTASTGQVITMNNSQTTITGVSSITLTDGGIFNMSAGTLGRTSTAMVTVTIGSGEGLEDSVFNITGGTVATAGQVDFAINAGGVLNVQNAQIGFGSGATVNIDINNGGTFNLRKDGRLGEVGSHVNITVHEGGVFNVDTYGNISARNVGSTTITVDGGTMVTTGNVLISACTYGELEIKNGGTFTQNGGAVAYGLISSDPRGVTVTVDNGSYVLNNGYFGGNMGAGSSKPPVAVSISNGGSFTQNGGAVGTFTTELTFELENASYTMYGGDLGNSSGTFNFTLAESSSFLMNGSARILGAMQFSVSSDSTFTQSGGEIIGSTHITLGEDTPATDEESDPTYSMTGGDIAGNVTIDVYRNASFVMSGDAEISGSASITLHGGSFTQQGGTFGGSASLILNAGASYTLADGTFSAASLSAGGADITIQQTGGSMQTSLTLENGAIFQQSGGSFSGSIAASGQDTAVTQQQDGTITDATITLTEGATFTQSGSVTGNIRVSGEDSLYTQESGIIGSGSGITLSEGGAFVQNGGNIFTDVVLNDATASFTQKGTLSGSVTLNGGATFTQESSGSITGNVTVNNGTFTQSDGSIGGNVTVDGSNSEFVQDGTISGDVTVSNGGHFANNDSAIQGSLTVDNASFNQSGTVGQDVAVRNGGTLTQSSADAVVSGNVTVSGSGSSFTQLGSIGGSVLLQSGTYTQQSGDIASGVEVQGGTYEQQGGSISGGLTLVKGAVTQQSAGSIRDGILMQGGEFTQNGSVTGNVVVNGGSYTMVSEGASITGDVTVTGANFTQEAGSITGNVSVVGGSFSQAGSVSGGVSLSNGADYILTTNGELSGGTLTIEGGSSFTLSGGSLSGENVELISGSITINSGTVSDSTIAAAAGSSITIARGNVKSSTSIVLTDAQLRLEASSMQANVEMNGASALYDFNDQKAEGNITIKGGNLANAGYFIGYVTIDTAADYTGSVNLGGLHGSRITSIYTRSADTLITGLMEGSSVSLSGGSDVVNSMVVGTNTSTTKISSGSDYLISFNGGSGTVSFKDDAQLALNFSSDLIIEATQLELEGEMRIHVTNGTLTATEENFVFGSGFKDYITFKTVDGGDIVVEIDVNHIWVSSQDGILVEDNTIAQDTMVVVDKDTTIHLKAGVAEATLHHLIGDGSSVGNLDIIADHEQTIALDNDTDGNTVYNGNITVSGDAADSATLKKTGAGTLTLGGVITTDGTLHVQEGKLVLNNTGNTVAMLNLGSDAELSVVGDLTLKDGVSYLNSGSITGGGQLTVNGGEVDFGAVTIQANLTVQDAEVTQGGIITGDVLVTGVSTFNQNADINGSVTLGAGANISGSSDANISGSVTILAEAQNAQAAIRGTIGQDVTISGDNSRIDDVTGVGGSVMISGAGARLTGNNAEISGSVTLSGERATVEGVTTIGGDVTVSGNSASLTTSGTISGTVLISGDNSRVSAAGLTNNASITGAGSTLTITGSTLSGDITLNGSGAALDLNNQTISNDGSITINDGKLVNANGYTGNVFINTSASISSDSISLGGLDAAQVQSIKTASDVSITDLATGSTLTLTGKDNMLTVGSNHAGLNGATAAEQLIQFAGNNGQIAFADNAAVMLQFTEELLSSFINGEMKIAITNGTIAELEDLADDAEILNWLRTHFLLATGSGLEFAFFTGEEGDNTIVITAGANNVWKTSDEFAKVTEVDTFDSYTKVIIDRTTTVTVAAEVDDDHMTIRQLEGSSDLNITNSGTEELTVELRNESFFNTDGEQQSWGATAYNGNISAAGGVNFEKTGNDTLQLNGNLSTDGDLDVTNGTLVLSGDNNSVGSLSFHKETAQRNDGKDVVDNVLEVSGILSLTGQSEMGSDEEGTIAGSGLIVVEQNAALKVGENVHLTGPAMQVEGELDVTATQDATLSGLFGSGTLTNGSHGLTISDGQGVFSGTLAGSGPLNISGSAQQTLVGLGNSDYDLNVTSRKATLTLEADGATYGNVKNDGVLRITPEGTSTTSAATGSVTVKSAELSANSSTEFVVNFDSAQEPGTTPILHSQGTVIMESGQIFVVEGIGTGVNMPSELEIVLVQADNGLYNALTTYALSQGDRLEDGTILQQVETRGLFNLYYENSQAEVKENGTQIVFTASHRTSNLFAPAADTVNSRAGSELLWEARNSLLVNADTTPTLAQATAVVADMAHTGRLAETRRALAAVAGSTVPAITAAQSDALRQQIDRTRQHAQPGLAAAQGTEKTAAHAWVEGIGTFARLSTQGDESGYTLNSWGGSVGADMKLNPHVTLGISLTALYGDLDATAAETATGKMDAYYLSFFVRGTSGHWVHSLALVGGISNANLDRRVDLGDFAYTTTGSTNGTALGAMYEVAYSIKLDQEGRHLLLPTAGIMINSVSMSNYSESGADGAGLHVSDQSRTVATLTLGTRWITELNADTLGKSAVLELSAAIAQDMGDTRSTANVALLGNPTTQAHVQGAESGNTSCRLGAGIWIPMGDATKAFINGYADLRSGNTLWNVNAGVQFTF